VTTERAGDRSIADRVAEQLLRSILAGEMAPGEPLPAERELAASLEVSRGSVREALRALAFLGVIEITHGGRARVCAVELETLLRPLSIWLRLRGEGLGALLEARVVIEVAAARIAATRIDNAALAALDDLLKRKRAASQRKRVAHAVDLDAQFHQQIIEATGNAFLIGIGRSLYELGRAGRMRTTASPEDPGAFLEDHERIVLALRRRDSEAAACAMLQHIERIAQHARVTAETPSLVAKTTSG
jgi:GntR family transcriptional repressor for pyruvate dehydrogenase complex